MYYQKQAYFVDIDTDKLTQVIDNIISNAMKYSPDGGNIRFGVHRAGKYAPCDDFR